MRSLTMVLLLLLPQAARAGGPQDGVPSGVNARGLATVFVYDAQGIETKGKLLRLDRHEVVIAVGGAERRFDLASVDRVEKRGDSLKNGAITGAVAGALLGLLAAGFSDCHNDYGYGACDAGQIVAFAAVSTAFYAAVGTGIDAAIQGRTTLYKSPSMAATLAASGGSLAARFSVRW
jgi:hypothetical protein